MNKRNKISTNHTLSAVVPTIKSGVVTCPSFQLVGKNVLTGAVEQVHPQLFLSRRDSEKSDSLQLGSAAATYSIAPTGSVFVFLLDQFSENIF